MEVANGCYCTSLVPGVSQKFAGSRNTQADSAALRCGLAGIATTDDLRPRFDSGVFLTLLSISFRNNDPLLQAPAGPEPSCGAVVQFRSAMAPTGGKRKLKPDR